MTSDARIYDRFADRYARTPVRNEAAYQHKLAMTRRHFRRDMQLLELGCGTGSTALVHAPEVGHIRAVDFSERMIDIAREKAADAGIRNVDFEQASINDIDPDDGPYDMVLALSVLHLLDDLDASLERIAGWLPPGGLFVSSTTCMSEGMAWFRWLAPLGRSLRLIPLVRFFDERQLRERIEAHGMRIEEEYKPEGRSPQALFLIARKSP